jgi:hypothetical protein
MSKCLLIEWGILTAVKACAICASLCAFNAGYTAAAAHALTVSWQRLMLILSLDADV